MKSLFRHPQVKFDKEKPDHTSLFNQESHLARKSNEETKRNAVGSNELLASLESLLASASHFVSASPQETFPRSRDSRQSRHPQLAAHRAHNLRTQHVFATRVLTPSFAFLENSRDHRGDIPATTLFCTLSLLARPLIFQEECSGYLCTFSLRKVASRRAENGRREIALPLPAEIAGTCSTLN